MICTFCQQETIDKSLPLELSNTTTVFRLLKVNFCEKCVAEYVYWSEGDEIPFVTNLYVTINGKMYRWSLHYHEEKGRLWYVEEPGEPGIRANKKLKLLKTFHKADETPIITPQNILEKVKLILLFM
jgi:hypothetical protein